MKISTRARYGTRAMMDLAMHHKEGAVLVKDIAQRQQISARYLEQLLFALKIRGLVRSSRGTRGGFVLAKPPAQIKLLDIVEALDGSIAPVACVDEPDLYARSSYCACREVWVEVKRAAERVLESITLEELAKKQQERMALAEKKGDKAVSSAKAKCG